jgi:cell division protease FtsH
VHKATIVPRGRALGLVMRLPEADRLSMSREKLHADLSVAMGGRVAEEIIFGRDKVTTGASSDISSATDMARRMVTEWGLSDKLGPLRYATDQEEVFLGSAQASTKTMSDDTAAIVDAEIRRIVDKGYKRATQILTDNLDDLHKLAQALIEYELLSGSEINDILAGRPILRDTEASKSTGGVPKSSVPTSTP